MGKTPKTDIFSGNDLLPPDNAAPLSIVLHFVLPSKNGIFRKDNFFVARQSDSKGRKFSNPCKELVPRCFFI